MKTIEFKHISEILDNYDILLFDLWGVIIEDDKFYPGIIDAVNEILKLKKTFFVSNAPRPAFIMEEKLENWGLKGVTKEMIVTSGDIAREIIQEKYPIKPVIYHLGEDKNNDILRNLDHIITDDYKKADIFLISMFMDENENIREFDDLLGMVAKEKSILKICSNPDISVPKGNTIRYCAGYFAQIVEENGGEVIYTGKPKKIIYDHVLKKIGDVAKNRILMIGDTFETDILGSMGAGINSALVMTGNARKFHKIYDNFEDKISALQNRSNKLKIFPTFVTNLV